MRPLFTGSSLYRARRCVASAVLPRTGSLSLKSEVGSAKHEHMQERALYLIDEAMERLPAVLERWGLGEREAAITSAQLRKFEYVPPMGALAEISLALRLGPHVEQIEGGRGDYDTGDPEVFFAATSDLVWSEPEPIVWVDVVVNDVVFGRPRVPEGSGLWVIDYKFGSDTYVEPAERNAQIRACGLLAALWTGQQEVNVGIVYPGEGQGEWDACHMGAEDLAATYRELCDVRLRAGRALEALDTEQGLAEYIVEGPHCGFCPSQAWCPAKTMMVKRVAQPEAVDVLLRDAALTPVDAARLAAMLPQLEAFCKRAKAALKNIVPVNGPIELPDGNVWGPYAHTEKVLDVDIAVAALAREIGDGEAAKAVKRALSRTAIEQAVKANHEARGIKRKASGATRKVMGAIIAAGGQSEVTETWWGPHKPRGAVEAPDDVIDVDEES